jgi:hypothetical protein
MTGEHHDREVPACAGSHVVFHHGKRIENSILIRGAVMNKLEHDLSIETVVLGVHQRTSNVLRIPVSKFQP